MGSDRFGLSRFQQDLMPKSGRQLANVQQAVSLAGELRILRNQFNAGLLGQQPQSLGKFQTLHFLNKTKDVAAFAAAKTVPNLLVARNHKQWRFFIMKKA